MRFKPIKPADGTLPSFCHRSKYLVVSNASVMAHFDVGGTAEVDTPWVHQGNVFSERAPSGPRPAAVILQTVIRHQPGKTIFDKAIAALYKKCFRLMK